MLFAMRTARKIKAGYTLVEVLVVVSIMGILSSMGVAGLQRAVAYARIKDSAMNTAAFMQRVADESTRLSTVLCLKIEPGNPQRLWVVRDTIDEDCSRPSSGVVDQMELEPPSQFVVSKSNGCPVMQDWFGANAKVAFKPRLGLSSAPPEGGICIRYGTKDVYGAVRKEKGRNKVVPMWKNGNDASANWDNWSEL